MATNKWVIKVNRPTPRLMWIVDNKADAERQCAELNERYQSAEYYVEEYDVEKARLFLGLLNDDGNA